MKDERDLLIERQMMLILTLYSKYHIRWVINSMSVKMQFIMELESKAQTSTCELWKEIEDGVHCSLTLN